MDQANPFETPRTYSLHRAEYLVGLRGHHRRADRPHRPGALAARGPAVLLHRPDRLHSRAPSPSGAARTSPIPKGYYVAYNVDAQPDHPGRGRRSVDAAGRTGVGAAGAAVPPVRRPRRVRQLPQAVRAALRAGAQPGYARLAVELATSRAGGPRPAVRPARPAVAGPMTVGGRVLAPARCSRLTTGVTVLTTGRGEALHGTTVSAVGLVSREPADRFGVCLRDRLGVRRDWPWRTAGSRSTCWRPARRCWPGWFADRPGPAGRAQFAGWLVPGPGHRAPLLARRAGHTHLRGSRPRARRRPRTAAGRRDRQRGRRGRPLLSFGGGLHGAELRDVVRARRGAAGARVTTIDRAERRQTP